LLEVYLLDKVLNISEMSWQNYLASRNWCNKVKET
jgi:hypothetical protein